MGEIRIISNGKKEGTKVFIDGQEVTTSHWRHLIWKLDFLLNQGSIAVEFLPPGDWMGLSPLGTEGDETHADIDIHLAEIETGE